MLHIYETHATSGIVTLMQNMSKLMLFKEIRHCKFLLILLNSLAHY